MEPSAAPGPERTGRLRRWGGELREIGFAAPPDSYLRGLFALPRVRYLERLLDRPPLLRELPRYRALQAELGLDAPVDTEREAALRTLRRVPRAPEAALRWIRRLRRDVYRFLFADLDLLLASVGRPALQRGAERPDSLRHALWRRLDTLRHASRTTTDLPEGAAALERLSRVDLLRIELLFRSLDTRSTRSRNAAWVATARGDSVETGGVVVLEEGEVRWVRLPSNTVEAGPYRRPAEPRFAVELVGFRLDATPGDDRPAAGPSLMDAMSAAFHGGPRLVLTDLGSGCSDVDYYRDAVAGRLPGAPRGTASTR